MTASPPIPPPHSRPATSGVSVPGAVGKALRSRLGLTIACLVICLLLGRAVQHAYVAAATLGVILAAGLLLPHLLIRLISARGNLAQPRTTVGHTLILQLTTALPNRLLPPLPLRLATRKTPPTVNVDQNPQFLAAGHPTTQTLHLTTLRRGRIATTDFLVECDFPFGFLAARLPLPPAAEPTIVWPAAITIDPARLAAVSAVSAAVGIESNSGSDGDFASVRGYRRGDSLRTVHWMQTARHDRLIVRERAASASKSCQITLDLSSASYATAEEFELAVALAAGAVAAARTAGISAVLALGTVRLDVIGATTNLVRSDPSLDALAVVESSDEPAAPASPQYLLITGSLHPSTGSPTVISTRDLPRQILASAAAGAGGVA